MSQNIQLMNERVGIRRFITLKGCVLASIPVYATVILSSVSAYIAGGIGFIGMIAPHIAKRLVGPNYKYFMPLSICLGANLVLFADIVSRFLVNSGQFVPIGTLISLIGAPYLLYLLFADDR